MTELQKHLRKALNKSSYASITALVLLGLLFADEKPELTVWERVFSQNAFYILLVIMILGFSCLSHLDCAHALGEARTPTEKQHWYKKDSDTNLNRGVDDEQKGGQIGSP